MTRFRACLLLCLVALATGAGSQEIPDDDPLELLLEGALTVEITARIIDQNDNEIVWNMDVTRVTVSGRAVSLRLEGNNILVEAEFTPYRESGDELILIAEGRTWIDGGATEDAPQYRTSFTTMPIRLGEPVLFLPLGKNEVPVETERFGRLNIELEVSVESYQS